MSETRMVNNVPPKAAALHVVRDGRRIPVINRYTGAAYTVEDARRILGDEHVRMTRAEAEEILRRFGLDPDHDGEGIQRAIIPDAELRRVELACRALQLKSGRIRNAPEGVELAVAGGKGKTNGEGVVLAVAGGKTNQEEETMETRIVVQNVDDTFRATERAEAATDREIPDELARKGNEGVVALVNPSTGAVASFMAPGPYFDREQYQKRSQKR